MKAIMAIDDEKDFLYFYRKVLANFYHVWTVENNELAINLLRKNHFHLIISDIKRPGGDGIDLLQFLIDHPELLPRKILFCSAWGVKSPEDVKGVMEQPNDLLVGMMRKPFKASQLRESIIKMLNGVPAYDI